MRSISETARDTMRLHQALRAYGFDVSTQVLHIYKNTWQVDSSFILKGYNDLEELEKVLRLNVLLRQAHIAVAHYLHTQEGLPYVLVENMGYTLAHKIRGTHPLPLEDASGHLAEVIGRETALLHQALRSLQHSLQAKDVDTSGALRGWISSEITKAAIEIPEAIWEYALVFDTLYHRLPRQLIHRDLHPQNLLFYGDELSGFLDFDISEINVRLFDLCYFGLSLLYDHYHEEATFTRWLEIYPFFLQGYHRITPISEEELEAIAPLSLCIEMLFTAFYARLGRIDDAKGCVVMAIWLYEQRERFRFALY